MSDLNSLYHGALKVAEMAGFPLDKVALVKTRMSTSAANFTAVGVEFCGSGLFVALDQGNDLVVAFTRNGNDGEWPYTQPLDRMAGTYSNLKLALVAAGMILSGALMYDKVTDTILAKQHDCGTIDI